LENCKFKEAANALEMADMLGPANSLTLKCLAVALAGISSRRAVKMAESLLQVLAQDGKPPDTHVRATYGFALLSARMGKEAAVQFEAGFGIKRPVMTVRQWKEWGHMLQVGELPAALMRPGEFDPRKRA
jgi:hypothetical protein